MKELSTSEKVDLEIDLLSGIVDGINGGSQKSFKHLAPTVEILAGSMAAGVVLGVSAHELKPISTLLGNIFKTGMAIDVGRRVYEVGHALDAVWRDPNQFDQYSTQMHKIGASVWTDAILFAGTYAGMKGADFAFNQRKFASVINQQFAAPTDAIPNVQPGTFRPTIARENAESDWGRIYLDKHAAIGKVVGDQARGTAFYVDREGLWATNHHVVAGQNTISVISNGHFYPAQLVSFDRNADLALLKTESIAAEPLKMKSYANLVSESRLSTIGHPMAVAPDILTKGTFINGYVEKFGREPGSDRVGSILLDVGAYPGSSGSPVLSARGEVVGVVKGTGRWTRGTHATAVDHLDVLLSETKDMMPSSDEQVLNVQTTFAADPGNEHGYRIDVSKVSEVSKESLADDRLLFKRRYGMDAFSPLATVWAGAAVVTGSYDTLQPG